MKTLITAFMVGVLFAIGLGISGMTDPEKVIGFLNFFGGWDPSLLFVMMGAIGVHVFAYRLVGRRQAPFFSAEWHFSKKTQITKSLVVGAVLFGLGWGLAGYCPGPAVASVVTLEARPLIFVLSMVVGMFLYKFFDSKFKFYR